MAKHIPEFIFDAVSALTARRFLSSSITLMQMSKFYSDILQLHYDVDALPSDIENCAEDFLRNLNEIGAENADEILKSFERIRLTTTDNSTPRKLKSMFSSALDAKSEKEHSAVATTKRFKAFIFLVRSKPDYYAPSEWKWSSIHDASWLAELEDAEIDPFNLI